MNEVDLKSNLSSVRQRIKQAAQRVGRGEAEIRLVAVSKKMTPDQILEAESLGVDTFGENYAQELRDKVGIVSDSVNAPVKWHYIGKLQSNKVKYVVGNVELIHSLDSVSVAREIDKRAENLGINVQALIEINTGGEGTKGGVRPDEIEGFLSELISLSSIKVKGLMTMAPYSDDPEKARPCFKQLREIRDGLSSTYPGIRELSMGMSGDFEVAVEEGATLVRIGTALFGPRQY